MKVSLKNKVIVVTGASKGLGKELALRLSEKGANLVINYNSSPEKAQNVYSTVREINPKTLLFRANVTKLNQVKEMGKKTIEEFGKVDVLINNAGISEDRLLVMMSENQWRSVLDVNLTGVFNCSKVFAKEMIKRKTGKIFNITSLKGQLGSKGQTNYSASKAGIIGLTKSLAKELAIFNIGVNAIAPGFIQTEINKHLEDKIEAEKEASLLNTDKCLEDFLNFMVLLSSDKINGVSGQVFNLDSRLI